MRGLFRYAVAVSLAALGVAIGLIASPVIPVLSEVFLGIILLCTLWGGTGPGLVATVLSAFSLDYFFVPPLYSIEFNEAHIARLLMFIAVALVISWLNNSLQEQRSRAEANAAEARRELLARTHTEQELRESLTEKARIEEELRRASQMKDTFLSNLSHELRTPLNAILGWSQMLLTSRLDNNTTKRALEAIHRSARTQAVLVGDMLDMSRIVSGKMALTRRAVHLTSLIDSAIDTVRASAQTKGVRITKDFHCEPIVFGDPDRLQQVFWNLLVNALKFTPHGGEVRIVADQGAEIEVRVEDTGIGIPLDFLPHVFDSFAQADGSPSRAEGGLGLGLAIVRSIVELHDGTVTAASPGPNQGATFAVRLPPVPQAGTYDIHRNDDMAALVKDQPISPLCGLRILIVDDHAETRDLLNTLLSEYGADVTVTASGEEALEQVSRGNPPNLIISDLAMPQMDGYEFIRRVRSFSGSQNKIPAIALTAYGREDDRLRALAEGYQQHVPKPIVPAEFVAVVVAVARMVLSDGVSGPA